MPPARASAHWLISPAAERRTSSSRKASFCLARSREPSQSTLYDIYALPSPAGLWRHSLQKTRIPHCGLIGLGNSINSELVFPDEAISFCGGQCLDQTAPPPPAQRQATGILESLK